MNVQSFKCWPFFVSYLDLFQNCSCTEGAKLPSSLIVSLYFSVLPLRILSNSRIQDIDFNSSSGGNSKLSSVSLNSIFLNHMLQAFFPQPKAGFRENIWCNSLTRSGVKAWVMVWWLISPSVPFANGLTSPVHFDQVLLVQRRDEVLLVCCCEREKKKKDLILKLRSVIWPDDPWCNLWWCKLMTSQEGGCRQ